MGAINYKTSDYITIVIEEDAAAIASDPEFIEFLKDEGRADNIEEEAAETAAQYYEDDRANYESIYTKYTFDFFTVELIPGYYDGLQIDIKLNNAIFDDWTEKREALKEATKIKEFLTECAGVGFKACGPGWVTKYYTYAETLEKIKGATKAIKEEIKAAPTYYSRAI